MEWKSVKGYEELYEVSDKGYIRSLPKICKKMEGKELKDYLYSGKILKPYVDRKGYLKVKLYKDGAGKVKFVHRVVLESFVGNPKELPQINHKNEDKTDNSLHNLEWCSASYNVNYGTRNKALEKPIRQMSKDGKVLNEFKSASEAAKHTGLHQSLISQCCIGKRKTTGGYRWQFL